MMLTCQGDYVIVNRSIHARIKVQTVPEGADIYFNGKLIGKTPQKVTLQIPYQDACSGMFFAVSDFSLHHVEKYNLLLIKEGYEPTRIDLDFKEVNSGKIELTTSSYEAFLKKKQ